MIVFLIQYGRLLLLFCSHKSTLHLTFLPGSIMFSILLTPNTKNYCCRKQEVLAEPDGPDGSGVRHVSLRPLVARL